MIKKNKLMRWSSDHKSLKTCLLMIYLVMVFTACTSPIVGVSPTVELSKPIIGPTQTATIPPIQAPTGFETAQIASSTPTSDSIVTPSLNNCLNIIDHAPYLETNPKGNLVILNRRLGQFMQINFFTGNRTTTNLIGLQDIAVSPEGRWIVYSFSSLSKPSLVESANGEHKIEVPWEWQTDLNKDLIGWIDEARLVFRRVPEPVAYAITTIYAPLSGEWNEFKMEDMDHPAQPLSSTSVLMGSINIMPDPSLRLLVYPMQDEDGRKYITLWDRQLNRAIARIEDFWHFGNDPLWSTDGTDFLIAVQSHPGDAENRVEDWFRVTRDGQVEQLTHFADSFQYADIEAPRRSPDGRKLAFWLIDQFRLSNGQWC
jgi:hypothetical protein